MLNKYENGASFWNIKEMDEAEETEQYHWKLSGGSVANISSDMIEGKVCCCQELSTLD